ncbi:MAG TPA: hypothetical protein VJT10_08445 [Steroidobacteraceae bacterium]|nr:hypothetical protein [Steroidobacteraceae bacterium]
MSATIRNRSGRFALLAITVMSLAACARTADALDWLGAIHVARVFGLVDPDGGSPDGPTVAKRLEETLTTVPPRIVSKAGQARAPQRVRELEHFLRDLRAESADLRSL